MGQSNLNLADLIGSRICHDLISPIGAINNGLELLEMSGVMQGPELDLIADSVGNAGARIRFFRIAYGAASTQLLGRPEIVSVLDDVSRGSRLTMKWAPLDPMPRSEVRLAFLALQCCETAMPYGGIASVTVSNGIWTVTGQADKLNIDDVLWMGLSQTSSQATITPALVQFALLPEVARDLDRRIRVHQEQGHVSLIF